MRPGRSGQHFLFPSKQEIPPDLQELIQIYFSHWKHTSNRWFESCFVSANPYVIKLSAHENDQIVCEISGISWESEQSAILKAFENMYFTGLLQEGLLHNSVPTIVNSSNINLTYEKY